MADEWLAQPPTSAAAAAANNGRDAKAGALGGGPRSLSRSLLSSQKPGRQSEGRRQKQHSGLAAPPSEPKRLPSSGGSPYQPPSTPSADVEMRPVRRTSQALDSTQPRAPPTFSPTGSPDRRAKTSVRRVLLPPPPAGNPMRPHTGGGAAPVKLPHDHNTGRACPACVVEKQRAQLESLRHQLARSKTEVARLQDQHGAMQLQHPSSPGAQAAHAAALHGVTDSIAHYRKQIQQLTFAVTQADARQANTEDLLAQALKRPTMPPPIPIKESGVQTFNLDAIDVLVNGEKQDSEGSASDSEDMRGCLVKASALDAETRGDLVNRLRVAVGQEMATVLEKSSHWLTGQSQAVKADDGTGLKDPRAVFSIPRIPLEQNAAHPSEELLYEMCAALGEAHAFNENQAAQISVANNFWKVVNAGILPMSENLLYQIQHHDVLAYIAQLVHPSQYCNNPLGFLLSRVVRAIEESDNLVKRQDDALHQPDNKRLDDLVFDDDGDAPNYNQWIDLTKRMIVLLSKNPNCLQPQLVLFDYEDTFAGVGSKKFAPLEFAVVYNLDEIALQICDAQERVNSDVWQCSFGSPFHKALEMGSERDNTIRYMLRAAASVPDDRFGLLKARDEDVTYPFYLALMYAHDIPGVMDPLLDILVKRNFRLNLKWTGMTPTDPPEEWHLLQWAAYQGVERIFKQTRTHPDFFQMCQTAQRPASQNPPKGNLPLHLACMSGSAGVVTILCHEISQVLKTHTAAMWNNAPTPLHIAAQQCHYGCLQAILRFAKDKWGWSAKIQEEKLFGSIEYRTKWVGADDDFQYSVYTMALLTLVHRRHKLQALTEDTTADEDIVANNEDEISRVKREIEIANHQVKYLNERHPPKLRLFAAARIRKYFYPWLIYIGMVTFFAASETVWVSDFVYYSSLAVQRYFESLTYVDSEGVEKSLHTLDNQGDVVEWIYSVFSQMEDTFVYTNSLPVGATRLRQIIISNDSCTIEASFFRRTLEGPVPCAGGVSSTRSEVFFIDWLFKTVLHSPRDDSTQYTEDIVLPSGRVSPWQTSGQTREESFISDLGYEYPASGYVLDFDWNNRTSYTSMLDDFRGTPGAEFGQGGGWMMLATRALIVTSTFYNPATGYYIAGYWLFELPAFGGVFVETHFNSLRLIRDYDNYLDYFTLMVEVLLGMIVLFMTARKGFEFRYILKGHFKGVSCTKLPSYIVGAVYKICSRGSNLLDMATIATFLSVFSLRLIIRSQAEDLEGLFSEHSPNEYLEGSFFFPFQELVGAHSTRLSALGIVLMFVYMKILDILRLHRNVGPISIAIVQTLFNKHILYFGVILMILLLALSFAAYFAYGEFQVEFSSLFKALLSLFRIIFGEYWEFSKLRKNHAIYGPLLLLFTVLFGSLLLINVLTAIIFDIYRARNAESEGSWETDLVDMQINEILHTLYLKGVKARKEEQGQSSGGLSILESIQSNAALNSAEVGDVIEWNRTGLYGRVYPKCPSLFPDTQQAYKALKDWPEEDRSADDMVLLINERCQSVTDRVEVVEKSIKDITSIVSEIHERFHPKGRNVAPRAEKSATMAKSASFRGDPADASSSDGTLSLHTDDV
ncbi:hypothetical protein DIPPA_04567 [Diplonema papillatum]|nr:hypothetical protein DIPPA_04567 [Diplonema papillatum]